MKETKEGLWGKWLHLLELFAVPPEIAEKTFDDLVTAYSAPERFYHTLFHIEDVLATIVRLNSPQHPSLPLACWFHDAVYDTHAQDNEEKSAALAGVRLKEMDIAAPIISATAHLILLTKNHVPGPEEEDGKVFLDADLAILGASAARYENYARAIRQEYAWVPEPDYRAGRAKVLMGFLNRPRVYHTEAMFAACEQKARQNMAAEIAGLTSS